MRNLFLALLLPAAAAAQLPPPDTYTPDGLQAFWIASDVAVHVLAEEPAGQCDWTVWLGDPYYQPCCPQEQGWGYVAWGRRAGTSTRQMTELARLDITTGDGQWVRFSGTSSPPPGNGTLSFVVGKAYSGIVLVDAASLVCDGVEMLAGGSFETPVQPGLGFPGTPGYRPQWRDELGNTCVHCRLVVPEEGDIDPVVPPPPEPDPVCVAACEEAAIQQLQLCIGECPEV